MPANVYDPKRVGRRYSRPGFRPGWDFGGDYQDEFVPVSFSRRSVVQQGAARHSGPGWIGQVDQDSLLGEWNPEDRLEEFGMEYAIRTGHVRMEVIA